MNRRAFLAAVGASVAGLSGCVGPGGSSTAPEYDVGMSASAFLPAEFEATVGEPVVWKNTSSRVHTVTAYGNLLPEGADYFASGGFDSEAAARRGYNGGLEGAIPAGDTYEHTFEVPGTHDYFCIPHERAGMVGKVVVRE